MADFGNLYLVRLYNENESFFKIGTSVHKYCRFHQIIKKGYEVEIIYMLLKIDFMKAYEWETSLHCIFSKQKYYPNIKFGGYTECYCDIDIDYYKFLIKDISHRDVIENYKIKYYY